MACSIRPECVAIYTRWSKEDQGQGTTPQEQMERCSLYVQSQGWLVTEDLIFTDEGESGGSLDRPSITRLREAVRAGKIDCVVTYRVDRLSRNIADAVDLVLREWRAGSESPRCHYKSATEQIDTTTPLGKMLFVLLSSFADWERETIRARTTAGVRRRISEGSLYGGRMTPYGYQRVSAGVWKLDDGKASVVKRIFRMVREGTGIPTIVNRLNREGVPTAQGGLWQRGVVKQILQNPIYCGRLVFGRRQVNPARRDDPAQPERVSGRHLIVTEAKTAPRIVGPEEWEDAQRMMKSRARRVKESGSRTASSPHLLSGLATCGCGGSMAIHYATGHGYTHRYYACTRRFNKGKEACESRLIPAEAAEENVVRELEARWGNPGHRSRYFDEMWMGLGVELAAAQERLAVAEAGDRRLDARLEGQMARLRAEYREGVLTITELRQNQADLEAERQRSAFQAQSVAADVQALQAAMRDRKALSAVVERIPQFSVLTTEQQRQILGSLLERVSLSRPKGWAAPVEVEIFWRSAVVQG